VMIDVTPAGGKFVNAITALGKNPHVRGDRLTTFGLTKNPGF